jgi:BTB/POZ domain-containing protein 9
MDSFPELKNFYLNELNSDITLIIEGNKMPSHKFVLSAKSSVFSAMFFGDMLESNAQEVEIKDAPIDAFKVMLKYVYSEQLVLDFEKDFLMAIEIFKIAHRFQFLRLVDMIEQSFIKMLKKHNYLRVDTFNISYDEFLTRRKFESSLMIVIENIVSIYEFALLYELKELINSCQRFITKNSKLIINKKSFYCNSFDLMESILGVMNISQTMIISALQTIYDSNPDSDMKQFEKLIDFELCSIDDINALRSIKIFSDNMLFEIIINKYKALQVENARLLKDRKF